MKKKLLFCVICLCVNSLFAQSPTLTMANSAWIPGNNAIQYNLDTNGIVAGVSGANVTWNFQNLIINTNQTIATSFVVPSSTPNYALFPGATVAGSANGVYQYFINTAATSSVVGIYGMGLSIYYSDPMNYFSYPFTYNSSSSDNFISDYLYGGYNFHRTGTVVTTGDAWGTLILPSKTINNVLRVKMVQNLTDAATGYSSNSLSTTYWWFDGINKTPVLEVTFGQSTNSYQPGLVSYSKRVFISPVALEIDEMNSENQNLKIYPNPAKDNFTLICNNENSIWEITDISGKSIFSGNITGADQKVDCGSLQNGIYLVRITNNKGNQSVQKLIINK